MTTLEKTSAVEIRRLVPRLMKLTAVGCKIKTKTGVYLAEEWDTADGTYIVYRVGGDKSKPNYARLPESTKFKTIGHPITLEDVLEAIRKCGRYDHSRDQKMEILNDGVWIYFPIVGHDERLKFYWQYGKPYSEQSPEVHNFVTNILFS